MDEGQCVIFEVYQMPQNPGIIKVGCLKEAAKSVVSLYVFLFICILKISDCFSLYNLSTEENQRTYLNISVILDVLVCRFSWLMQRRGRVQF